MNYTTVILFFWGALVVVWIVGSFKVKRDIRGGGIYGLFNRYKILQIIGVALVVIAVLRFTAVKDRYARAVAALFEKGVFAPPPALGWFAAALVALGILFAVWARFHLGRNWSGAPAVKEKPELVTSGPYRFVRHPIYAGIVLAAFGTALTGTPFGIYIFVIASVIFLPRMNKEEKIMFELFPNEYPAYRARTKRLIPFVW